MVPRRRETNILFVFAVTKDVPTKLLVEELSRCIVLAGAKSKGGAVK